MSLPLRTAVATFLAVLAAAVWFLPTVDGELKSLFGLCLMLISAIVHPQTDRSDDDEKPPQIIWKERDAGEKFSIIMFHALILTGLAFLAIQLAEKVDGLLGNLLAASLLCAGVWLTVRNWKNRNAR